MRVFEAKPSSSVAVEHGFQRGRNFEVSSTIVKLNVYHVKDETEFTEISQSTSGFVWDVADAMLLGVESVYNAVSRHYDYTLAVGNWNTGIYLLEWEANLNGAKVFEYDKLYVVRATQAEVIESLTMPSTVNAGGVTIDYQARLRNLTSQRGVRVGNLSKRRGTSNADNAERDYPRH